jgi:hypothetical protein
MKTFLSETLTKAGDAGLIPVRSRAYRQILLRRARRALKRAIADPGDCRGDAALLVGLAIAEAHIGRSAGWIPEVQALGCKIADLA